MTAVLQAPPGAPAAAPGTSSRRASLVRGRVPAVIAVVTIAIFLFIAIFADAIAPHDPFAVSRSLLQPPSADHPVGTDDLGKDVASLLIYGARTSLFVGIAAGLGSFVIGVIVGGIAGYVGGTVDTVLMRIAEVFQILPAMLIALVIVAVIGRSTTLTAVAVIIALWPQSARVVRSQFLALRKKEFVEAARISRTPVWRIILLEILPVALAPAAVQAALDVGRGMLLEASLSFLGLGDPNAPSWGAVLRRAQPYLTEAWWLSIPAGLCIAVMVLSFNVLGESFGKSGSIGRRAM